MRLFYAKVQKLHRITIPKDLYKELKIREKDWLKVGIEIMNKKEVEK